MSSRDWETQVSPDEMDVGSAVTPKTSDQVLTVRVDEAGEASHDGTGEAGTSRWSDAMSEGAEAMDESADASACE